MRQCVFCGSENNLNTQMTISLDDGKKISVDICDEHAEDATVKSARIKYTEKQQKIAEFLLQAKALGIDIPDQTNSSNLIVAVQKPVMQQQIIQQPADSADSAEPADIDQDDKTWISTDKFDSISQKGGGRSTGGSTEFGAVQSHSSYEISGQKDVLPENARRGKVKMSVAQGRAGIPIVVPEKRVDGTGTTKIRILHTEDDNSLQRRFKSMADDSIRDRQPDFRNGYDAQSVRTCPVCRGQCVINNKDCPKCHGVGEINVG